jgi:hypothetical protein
MMDCKRSDANCSTYMVICCVRDNIRDFSIIGYIFEK